jgi:hypothetical protein
MFGFSILWLHDLINDVSGPVLAMVDCGGRFCYNRHGQFVKDGDAIAFYGSLKWWIFRFPLSTINNKI